MYITGDTHGLHDIQKIRKNKTLSKLSSKDYLLIAGDFGGIWSGGSHDKEVLDFYQFQPFTTLFIDGNHENFSLLEKYPVERWNGVIGSVVTIILIMMSKHIIFLFCMIESWI